MDSFPVCTHCGFTFGEYRARGLLGCPHCYAGFGEALQGDIAWLHQALALTADTDAESAVPLGNQVSGSASGPHPTAPGTTEAASEATASSAASVTAPAGGTPDGSTPEKPDAETLARWREQIAAAVRVENYEEAARLHRLIRSFGSMGSGPGLGLA
jgi:protein-arginine kinase activator protein McsA